MEIHSRNESEAYQINKFDEINVCVTCYFIKLVMCLAFYIDQWGRFASMNSLDSAFTYCCSLHVQNVKILGTKSVLPTHIATLNSALPIRHLLLITILILP